MIKMDRYIARYVLSAIVLVLIVLTVLNSLFTLLSELGNLRMDYQFPQAVLYILMSMPNMVLQVLPVSTLIGCIVGLGALASHSELVVMRASGMSLVRICWAVIKPTLILIMLGMLMGEYVVPHLQSTAEEKRSVERSYDGTYSDGGLWWREGQDYIYIGNVQNDTLKSIDVLSFDGQHKLLRTMHAAQAVKQGRNWELEDVSSISYSANGMKRRAVKRELWDVNLNSTLLKMAVSSPENLSISNLFTYIHYMNRQHLDARLYQLSLYNKLFEPLAIISLLLIGVSFIFGPLRSVTMGYRLFMGVSTGVLFMLLQNLMGPASIVFGFPPVIAVLFPIVICLGVAFLLLRRAG